jgi:hypothetical protein
MISRPTKSRVVPAKASLPKGLLDDLRHLIASAKERVAVQINAEMTHLYWHIGRRISKDILKGKRAGYSEGIVDALSQQLLMEFGKGFDRTNLFRMVRFAEVLPEMEIVGALSHCHIMEEIDVQAAT